MPQNDHCSLAEIHVRVTYQGRVPSFQFGNQLIIECFSTRAENQLFTAFVNCRGTGGPGSGGIMLC